MDVAWIGLGRIGKPMALRVLAAGFDLVGHARVSGKHTEVVRAGGRLTISLVEAVKDAAIVCINVFSESQLREVLISGGALAAMRPGTIVVIHSTVGPTLVREIGSARSDVEFLDAAFSGTDTNAAEGTIALMVDGDADVVKAARPVLSTYANFIAHVGGLGTGMTIKLVNNALFGAQMLLAHDAINVLLASGIDKEVAVKTLSRSSGASFAIGRFGGAADPGGVMAGIMPYMEKDIAAALVAAQEARLDLGTIAVATQAFVVPFVSGEPR